MAVDANTHWRDSARPVKFFIWDGRAVFPIILFLFYPTFWTLGIAFGLIIFLSVLNRFGFSPVVFLRWLRSQIAGPHKIARPWWLE